MGTHDLETITPLQQQKPRMMLVGPLSPEPIIGGIENGVRLYLRSSIPQEVTCSFFNTYRKPSERMLAVRIASQSRMILAFLAALIRHRPRLVHVKSSSGIHFYQQASYAALALMTGRRLIFQIHSGHFETFFRSQPNWLQAGSRWLLEKAHCVICLTPYWSDVLKKLSPGCHPVVIPNAVELAAFQACAADRPVASDEVTLLFIGTTKARLNRMKGIYDLLQTLSRVDVSRRRLRVILAGCDPTDREEADAIANFAAKADVNVEVYGAIDEVAKLKLFAQAHIFILPSHVENLPNTVLEAMAAGLPVVATQVGGVPDLVQEEINGFLCPPGDVQELRAALQTLLDHPDIREQMAARNIDTIRSIYDSPVAHGDLKSLYEQVAAWERETFQARSTAAAKSEAVQET